MLDIIDSKVNKPETVPASKELAIWLGLALIKGPHIPCTLQLSLVLWRGELKDATRVYAGKFGPIGGRQESLSWGRDDGVGSDSEKASAVWFIQVP